MRRSESSEIPAERAPETGSLLLVEVECLDELFQRGAEKELRSLGVEPGVTGLGFGPGNFLDQTLLPRLHPAPDLSEPFGSMSDRRRGSRVAVQRVAPGLPEAVKEPRTRWFVTLRTSPGLIQSSTVRRYAPRGRGFLPTPNLAGVHHSSGREVAEAATASRRGPRSLQRKRRRVSSSDPPSRFQSSCTARREGQSSFSPTRSTPQTMRVPLTKSGPWVLDPDDIPHHKPDGI